MYPSPQLSKDFIKKRQMWAPFLESWVRTSETQHSNALLQWHRTQSLTTPLVPEGNHPALSEPPAPWVQGGPARCQDPASYRNNKCLSKTTVIKERVSTDKKRGQGHRAHMGSGRVCKLLNALFRWWLLWTHWWRIISCHVSLSGGTMQAGFSCVFFFFF